ncbi:family 16 glycoside hydrolase [Pirellula sp. SH-Sr6A]|uniref:family 16 glycoside hydrolase n=1 Tax=Pirellula sp. SH-Sr6A TaxID=1632865 RepID=UPI00143BCE70|nr:family 16 glycoside hydrolase [Pirellula sp. SH-Sr6A]
MTPFQIAPVGSHDCMPAHASNSRGAHAHVSQHRTLWLVRLLMLCVGLTANHATIATATPQDEDFSIQGEYAGKSSAMQVIALGDDSFEIVLFGGGLPGAGWDRLDPERIEGDRDTVRRIASVRGVKKTERSSPTLGTKPPAEAMVLFDGSAESLERNWLPGAKFSEQSAGDERALLAGATTRQGFQDYSLHLEFRIPFEPQAEGQSRGNSGVYHQGRYETQVLDSFGLNPTNRDAGSIYEVSAPVFNAALPPGVWQTYDVDFTAARFDTHGNKIREATLSVRLNGQWVQRNVSVPSATRSSIQNEGPNPGPIHLQDHESPVLYRNIWLVPRDSQRDAIRPWVAGFERFQSDESASGIALLTQLRCTACHASSQSLPVPQPAPNLSSVGKRVRPDHLLAIASNPSHAKPGTTMPDLLHGLPEGERDRAGRALASYLATTGRIVDRPGDAAAAERGSKLYHSIGCVACHAPRGDEKSEALGGIPLGNLTEKYTVGSLSDFLLDPHAIRAGGAMPKLVQNRTEARDIACYLLGDRILAPSSEQFQTTVFHGEWDRLPDFSKLTPVKSGKTNGLDLSFAGRSDQFAMVFEAYLPLANAGQVRFFLGSDDGSRLLINDREVIRHDGIHPHTEKSGRVRLEAGVHRLRLEYFEGNGQESLSLEVESPDTGRVPASMLVTLDPKSEVQQELIPSQFRPDDSLVEQGKQIFFDKGCVKCHAMESKEAPSGLLQAKRLEELSGSEGCLSGKVPVGLPQYYLTREQRHVLQRALQSLRDPQSQNNALHHQLMASNCYACHQRGEIGGPEVTRDRLFLTTTQEMGNEGRVPPMIQDVGRKLKEEVLASIVANGAKDRPYMLTRMPGFGAAVSERLTHAFVKEDTIRLDGESMREKPFPPRDSEEGQELSIAGRKLVGSDGLACIKCHVFGGKSTPGIQAMDLLRMTSRLREDWFHRYMLDPTRYRPGTRMPLSFPDGKSAVTSIFHGDADKQIDALWAYLSEGTQAKSPIGLDGEAIVLTPTDRPILYRNFLEGLTPRGIAVGYPEKVNIAWDANEMALRLIWKNEFIDASKHWVGRGPGNQGPLGDSVVRIENTSPIALLESLDSKWPGGTSRQRGFRFGGYRLNEAGQPSFEYRIRDCSVTDTIIPYRPQEESETSDGETQLKRTLKIRVPSIDKLSGERVVFRIAAGEIQERPSGEYLLDDRTTVRIDGIPLQRVQIEGRVEWRAELPVGSETVITQTIDW